MSGTLCSARTHRWAAGGAIAVATAAGGVLALQAWVNGRLGDALGDGVAAATVSDASSFLLLALFCPFLPGFRQGVDRLRSAVRRGPTDALPLLMPRHFFGGVVGGVVVLSQATTTALLGAALYTIALVAGQTLSGLWVDHHGVGPGPAVTATPRRLAGAGMALVAVVLPLTTALTAGTLWMAALPFVAGLGLSWQMAVNGRLNVVARSPYPSVALNFLLGVAVVAVALAVDLMVAGLPRHWPHHALLYSGGLLGAVFVLLSVLLVRHIGVLVMGLAMVAGQTLGSLALDLTTGSSRSLDGLTLLSALIVVAAAFLATSAAAEPVTDPRHIPDREKAGV
ncbi:DMT family transporter [Streptomyces huasconensis]|uniref:DMT family transporter n=1 Tax=Streptomyces huasconensis TaxID=1854574 RepID=A0ABV3LN58_9ACTN